MTDAVPLTSVAKAPLCVIPTTPETPTVPETRADQGDAWTEEAVPLTSAKNGPLWVTPTTPETSEFQGPPWVTGPVGRAPVKDT